MRICVIYHVLKISSLALGGLLGVAAANAQQLQIISPSNGTVVTMGQTISIMVAADSSISPVSVFTTDPLPEVQPATSANVFSLSIPSTIPAGSYQLTAVGILNGSDIESDPVTIDIEPPTLPSALAINPQILIFDNTNEQLPLQVIGVFGDSRIDITKSSYLTYLSENVAIATVSPIGLVTSVKSGGTKIDISYDYGYLSYVVPVQIPLGTETPRYNVTIVPIQSIIIDQNGNYDVFLKITNNSNVTLSTVNLTEVTLGSASPISQPLAISKILPGTSRSVPLIFPSTAGTAGQAIILRVQGNYVGVLPGGATIQPGAISSTFRMVL